MRRILSALLLASVVALSCKGSGDAASSGDAGKVVKLYCKMNNQCWVCPNDEAMKKCILNPVTSGCKQGGAGDCP